MSPGMDRDRTPIALRIAARLLPRETREEVLGDLVEMWRTTVRGRPRRERATWLARQPLATLLARTRELMRGAATRPDHGDRPASGRTEGSGMPGGPVRGDHDARRWPPRRAIGFSWLDVKLAVRMLGKQPILTIVAGLTLALGIPWSLAPMHLLGMFGASLPVEEGHRVVGIRNWDLETGRAHLRPLHDLAVWRESLRSFEAVGAARSDPWNVHSPDGRAAEVRGAEVTASVFELLRVPPILGRTLLPADEVEGAEDVVVISADLWASRFARRPDIVGAVIGIGRRPHTVVGVMPSGFLFPFMDHLWLPLRADPDDFPVGGGPDLRVYGRLADGVSFEQATAEVETVGGRLAARWPETHQMLRPEVVSVPILDFGEPAGGFVDAGVLLAQLFAFALLAVACGNVGVLILARTATRLGEISVRTALGASRARILGQMFVESLVLSVAATGAGLALAQWVIDRFLRSLLDGNVPYWFDPALHPGTVLLALGVAAACAVLAGVLPAIKATSPNIQRNLQRNAAGTTLRFGPFTTVLVVAEVALSVGFLCLGSAAVLSFTQNPAADETFEYGRYLTASLRTPWVEPTEDEADEYLEEFGVRVAENHEALRDRLRTEPDVRRVAMGIHLPGSSYPDRYVTLGGDDDGAARVRVVTGRVHVDYFRDLGLDVLEGRDFASVDVDAEPGTHRPSVIVNDQFVQKVFGGGEAVGRSFRYGDRRGSETGDPFEIVGVVETFATNVLHPERGAAVYHPLGSAEAHPMRFVVEVDGDPVDFIPRLRRVAAGVDPEAMIQGPRTVSEMVEATLLEQRLITWFVFTLSAMGMALAATGLYALMSFTVAQRRREIGIRTALGAGPHDVVATIARRAFLQLVAGVALGMGPAWWMVGQVAGQSEFTVPSVPGLLLGVALAVIAFSSLACTAPTLRGLRIQPTEALKEA